MTTELLEKAFAEAAKLPEPEQNALATLVLEEMNADKAWEASFAKSQDVLSQLAEQALTAYRQGETRPFNLDER